MTNSDYMNTKKVILKNMDFIYQILLKIKKWKSLCMLFVKTLLLVY